ncbi:Non-specific lipid-transfer protein [Papilio machaon]|uniref:propanoyl-CoA C-acyltransferase n=1 Tax=Papilio machaon TaxID=76193 RepID=A0A0N1PKC5_PAPMA|nr:Non-specific lipid-transfer protein [Papilio machaon]
MRLNGRGRPKKGSRGRQLVRNGTRNPRAQSKREYTVEEILNSRRIYGPLTKLECCPTSDGAGAAVLMSEDAVKAHGLQDRAVEIIGMEMATDTPAVFQEKSCMKVVGTDMTALAASRIYQKTGVSPKEVDVVELHDCFACNEMIVYEGLQLCGEGEAAKFIDAGDNTYGGRVVVNPSGGLIAKGHPIGATGLAQCAELVWQLRGEAGPRQVPKARIGLQHNLGVGGAVVITMYKKGFQNTTPNKVAATENIREDVQNARIGLQHNLGLGGAVVVAIYRKGFDNKNQRDFSFSHQKGKMAAKDGEIHAKI